MTLHQIINKRDRELPNEIRFNRHRKRKNNDIVAAMYAMYESGKSCSQIGDVYGGISKQSVTSVFRTRGYSLRHRIGGRYASLSLTCKQCGHDVTVHKSRLGRNQRRCRNCTKLGMRRLRAKKKSGLQSASLQFNNQHT